MTGYGRRQTWCTMAAGRARGRGWGTVVVAEVVSAGGKQIQDTSMFWEWIWPGFMAI